MEKLEIYNELLEYFMEKVQDDRFSLAYIVATQRQESQ
jgi:hypothetical protein